MVDNKERIVEYYKKSADDLPLLPVQVYFQVDPMQNQWTPATITQEAQWHSQVHTP